MSADENGWKICFFDQLMRRASGAFFVFGARHTAQQGRFSIKNARRGGHTSCQKITFPVYGMCRGDHGSPANLAQHRVFRDSFLTRQTGTGEQCSPLQELIDSPECARRFRFAQGFPQFPPRSTACARGRVPRCPAQAASPNRSGPAIGRTCTLCAFPHRNG